MAEPFTLIRFIDTETTGTDDPCEMVEVGWTDVRLFPAGWEIESGPHSQLVRPGMPITFPAMAVHHITDVDVSACEHADDVRREIVKGADILCAHNVSFDSRFIRGHRLPWICTFKAARTAWPELQGHSNGSIRYERGLCPDDVRALPSHRAGPDTWVTAHILLDLLRIYQPETLIEITGKPVLQLTCYLKAHKGKRWSEVPWDYLDWIVNKSDMRSDPKSEDVVFTAQTELAKRAGSAPPPPSKSESTRADAHDPDAWRKEMEKGF